MKIERSLSSYMLVFKTKCRIFFLIIFQVLGLYTIGCSSDPESSGKEEQPKGKVTLQWDQSTLTRVSSSAMGENYCGYARMVQLSDRELLCIYEADGNVVSVRSNNLGQTWSAPVVIASKRAGVNMAVPDILQLSNGSLLAMYNPRPHQIDPSRRFGIALKKSTDKGSTWGEEKILYEAGYQFENGCWEPAAIQLPDGEIQLYFANEGVFVNSNEQNISLIRSRDNGESWTTTPEVASFRKGSRDGMPVPLLLKNLNKIVVAIEDNGTVNFKPYIINNAIDENWKNAIGGSDKNRQYALAARLDDNVYAGAPYIRQLSTGETILSYQGTEGRRSNDMNDADMKVVVGDKDAANFQHKSVPFNIPAGKSALWNSIAVLDDDTIIALTSTNAFSKDGKTEVWMIKGRLKTGI